jgi:Ca2+-binding RTX toxin-like protein
MPSLKRIALIAALAASALPAAAGASTVTVEGDKIAIRGAGTESNYFLLSITERSEKPGVKLLQIADNAAPTYPQGVCEQFEYDPDRVYCPVPAGGVIVEGGEGNDTLSLFSDWDPNVPAKLYGGPGKDNLQDQYNLAGVKQYLDGGAGDDVLKGYVGSDVLIGGDGNDELNGGEGDDELRGGAGNDLMYGDLYGQDWGADILDGGEGFDTGDAWYIPTSDANNPPVHITQDGKADDGRDGENDNVTSVEKLETNAPSGTFNGTEGDDEIVTRSQDHSRELNGLGGNDKLEGGYGTEKIDGGAGADAINGGYGHDTITGGPGADVINGDGGSYCSWYGSCNVPFGNDTIYARDGEVDQIECGVGEDTVEADANDVVAESCEKVDKAGGSGGGSGGGTGNGGGGAGGGGGGSAADDAAAQSLAFTVVGKRSLRSGMAFRVTCAAACEVSGDLLHKGKKVGTGRKTSLGGGQTKVTVKLTKAGKKKLRRLKKASLTLKVTVKQQAGNTAFSRTLGFKR